MSPPSSSLHDPQELYTELTTHLLTSTTSLIPLTIEILPSPTPHPTPLLFDNPHLALTKPTLLSSFLIAHHLFTAHHRTPIPSLSQSTTTTLLSATAILLLTHPEHLTAANWRKRYLVHFIPPPPPPPRPPVPSTSSSSAYPPPANPLHAELTLLTTLLASPLPRHAKSPSLWHHRLWLLTTYTPYLLPPTTTTTPDAPNPLTTSLPLVLIASTNHPRNYPAFAHLRRLHHHLQLHTANSTAPSSHPLSSPSPLSSTEEDPHTRKPSTHHPSSIRTLHAWCLAHPRDISGWAFLEWMMRRVGPEAGRGDGEARLADSEGGMGMEREREKERVVGETRRWVERLGWKGESVEWFLEATRGVREGEGGAEGGGEGEGAR
ncbi:hypothetical protein MMC20_000655 [Loxospora ochrophaea]|nr:hypothetical protein [Loxospora ochrophaea]